MRLGCILLVVAAPSLLAQQPLSPFQQAKAATLLRTQLPCLGCHELHGEGGRSAPSLATVSSRRDAGYIRAIVEDPQRVVRGSSMPKTPMPPAERELVIRYLSRDALPADTGGRSSAGEGAAPRGSGIAGLAMAAATTSPANAYARWCASCHGVSGRGDGPNARFLPVPPAVHASAAGMGRRSDDALYDAISGGGLVMGKSPRMPAFAATLSPAEIRALVAYIRGLCACAGPTWSRDGGAR